MGRVRRVHFVGIGGAGMSGIAEVMLNLGYQVQGSDLRSNAVTQRLQALGATVFPGHDPRQVADVDVVVVSSAVTEANPEVSAARGQRIPVVPRAEMLAELMRFRYGIAVAGTHGKTTTTSLVASLLAEADMDPTYVIGGKLNSADGHARLGTGRYLVAEADESDASFLYLQPMIGIVTNIDADHLETYGGDFGRLRQTFVEFLHHLPFYGLAVLCLDDAGVRAILPEVTRPFRTYSIDSAEADLYTTGLEQRGLQMHFNLHRKGRGDSIPVVLNLPGRHNVLNALAAVVVADELGIPDAAIRAGLSNFSGIARRSQFHGELQSPAGPMLLVDDYGHHPSEISATLAAIKAGWPERRLVVVFQPHRYTRTRDLFEDFSQALAQADVLLLCEVYAAGETPIAGADGRALCRAVRARGKVDPVFVEGVDEVPEVLGGVLEAGDVVLTLGAGDIGTVPARLEALWPAGATETGR
ncbi:UDP-N-acetylmuramate--L-alanine ligase [Thiohalobacter thiocyanaticus]|uniref:UDP-N-acetylmuramate--L-alanine ligase n=2 Tax=Thiohalobacter thiocyanaticus TaxID=585455 RepID=A0A426QMY5_9GAMM|nr:UDP-N-acetylmuramate--L-alanine ligase [Thiohalobacter thiocyanaticus]